jgi:copper transporter 1
MHMDHGHGGMDHGDMDMGGQCDMNVRYSSEPRDNTCIGSR